MNKTITVDGVEYGPIKEPDGKARKIVRSRGAGVFFGTIESRNDTSVILTDARRLWYWDGAASLSQLAMSGTSKPKTCKFPEAVTRVELFEVVEILDVTKEAGESIDAVTIWKA